MKAHPTPSAKLAHWLSYSGMATAFMAVTPKAEAQVLAVDLDPDVVLVNSSFDIDFDSDGVVDMHIQHFHVSNTTATYFASAGWAKVNLPNGQLMGSIGFPGMYPSLLASAALIAPGDPNFQESTLGTLAWRHNTVHEIYHYGNFAGNTGFIGCRFTAGDGDTHYAWVQVSVTGVITNTTVKAYGYERIADTGIAAGDMGQSTGINDASTVAFEMVIVPNPTTDRAVINLPETRTTEMRISLVNSNGRTLFTDKVGTADRYTLNMADYAAGVYFVRLQDGKQVVYSKVAKQ